MKQIILTILLSLSMLAVQAQEQQAEKGKALSVNQDDKDFTIYPNPSNGVFTVSLTNTDAKRAELRIMNVIGNEIYREVLTRDSAQLSATVDLSRYSKAKGLYYVKLETDDFSVVRRIIVR